MSYHWELYGIYGMLQLDEPHTGPVVCIEAVNRRKRNQKKKHNIVYCNAINELVLLSFFLTHSKDPNFQTRSWRSYVPRMVVAA